MRTTTEGNILYMRHIAILKYLSKFKTSKIIYCTCKSKHLRLQHSKDIYECVVLFLVNHLYIFNVFRFVLDVYFIAFNRLFVESIFTAEFTFPLVVVIQFYIESDITYIF